MSSGQLIVGLVIAAALCFDFTNGFHDTAHAMAAVTIAAILNFVGAFISKSADQTALLILRVKTALERRMTYDPIHHPEVSWTRSLSTTDSIAVTR